MNTLQQAKNAITSANKETVSRIYMEQWRSLSSHDKTKMERWFKENDIADKVRDAPNNRAQYEKKELQNL